MATPRRRTPTPGQGPNGRSPGRPAPTGAGSISGAESEYGEEEEEEDDSLLSTFAPIARSGGGSSAGSELDEYIHLGEEPAENANDIFADIPEVVEEEDDSAPIPRIERDTKMEEEIEREKVLPLDELVKDVPVGSLDPVRMYLSDIGKHPLLTGEEEVTLSKAIAEGVAAQERMNQRERDRIMALLKAGEYIDEEEKAEWEAIADGGPLPERDARIRLLNEEYDSEEEKEDLELIVKGKEAHDKLANSNLRLVVSVAKRYIGRGLNFLDLIQEGNLGLLRAVDKFDHTLGYKFSTYAMWWIRQATSRAIADQARTIRIPVHMVETINKQTRAQRTLQQEHGREPWIEELALEMDFVDEDDKDAVRTYLAARRAQEESSKGESSTHNLLHASRKVELTPQERKRIEVEAQLDEEIRRRLDRATEKVRRIQRLSQEPLSLQTPVGNEENSSLGDFIEDDSLPGPVDTASRRLLREQMAEILDGLNERERKVLIMRFGLEDGIPRTLEDVGKEFQVTRERVRQIEAKALRKLRHPLRSRKLRDYL